MNWSTIEGLSAIIRQATWWIAISAFLTGVFTVVVIVADKKRERLVRASEQAKELLLEETRRLANEAGVRAGKLESENLESRGKVAALEIGVADAKKHQAEAEKALLEVQKKQAPRTMPIEAFVTAFGKARPAKAIVQYQMGNEETAMFAAGSVAPALVASGWLLEGPPSPIQSAHPRGIVAAMSEVFLYTNLKGNPEDPVSPIAGLRRAFSNCGFPPTIMGNNSLPDDTVLVVIGSKL